MKAVYSLNKALLFACISMYFGTGWSLILFSFPVADKLTTATYYLQFVPQVTEATIFFTTMTKVLIVSAVILIIEEWKTKLKWFGIGILLATIIATALTIKYIFPYNAKMAAMITSETELKDVLKKWMDLNIIRVSIWTVQWLLAMIYFLLKINKPISAYA